jgi:hypothetical protein
LRAKKELIVVIRNFDLVQLPVDYLKKTLETEGKVLSPEARQYRNAIQRMFVYQAMTVCKPQCENEDLVVESKWPERFASDMTRVKEVVLGVGLHVTRT